MEGGGYDSKIKVSAKKSNALKQHLFYFVFIYKQVIKVAVQLISL